MRIVGQVLSVLSHAIVGGLVFLVAYLAASFYFMSLIYPRQDCAGAIDRPLSISEAGDQVRMKDQTCGLIPRVETVSLYVSDRDGEKRGAFLSYAPDGATPRASWTSPHRVLVTLPSVRSVSVIQGRVGENVIDYAIGRVRP